MLSLANLDKNDKKNNNINNISINNNNKIKHVDEILSCSLLRIICSDSSICAVSILTPKSVALTVKSC